MAWLLKNAVRPDTFPIVVFCGIAVAMAGGHLTRLALDPHTMPLKHEDEKRPWEQRIQSRYMTAKWTDVLEKKKPSQ